MFNTISPYGSNRSNQIEGRKKLFLKIFSHHDLNIHLVLTGFFYVGNRKRVISYMFGVRDYI